MMTPEDKHLSKWLSYILRHHPEAARLTLNREGWADTEQLLAQAQAQGKMLTHDRLAHIVAHNGKQRFTLSADGKQIRAAQGHSTPQVHISHAVRTPPAVLYHGTAQAFLPAIRAEGLLPGQRHHVHLSGDEATARQVGARHGKPAVLQIDCAALIAQGQAFYLSDNGVWLTDRIDAAFIRFPEQAA